MKRGHCCASVCLLTLCTTGGWASSPVIEEMQAERSQPERVIVSMLQLSVFDAIGSGEFLLGNTTGNLAGLSVGACCVDGECLATNTEAECIALADDAPFEWVAGEDCATYACTPSPLGACCIVSNCEPVSGQGAATKYQCMVFANDNGFDYEWYEGESCPDFVCPLPPTGACCLYDDLGNPTQCETTDVEACSIVGGFWYEGEDCFGSPPFACPVDPCGEDALYALLDTGSTGAISDNLGEYRRADWFDGLTGGFSSLSWFGMNRVNDEGWGPCDKTPDDFEIIVYGNLDNPIPEPDLNNILCGPYTVSPAKLDTGETFNTSPIWRYDVLELVPVCTATEGWLSIGGLDNGEDNCWFLWHSSIDDDNSSWIYRYPEFTKVGDGLRTYDLSMCLNGEYIPSFGACCDDETGACSENIEFQDCLAPLRHVADTLCADLAPDCGTAPGACCHLDAGCDVVDNASLCNEPDDIWLGRNTFCEDCPCRLICPEGADLEGEECGTGINGGCSNQPGAVPNDLTLGVPVCGHAWAEDGTRDTDWYIINLEEGEYTLTVEAEYFVGAGFIRYNEGFEGSGNCNETSGFVSPYGTVGACTTLTVDTTVTTSGIYWVWISTNGFDGIPCQPDYGNAYVAVLEGEIPPCPFDLDGNGAVGPGDVGVVKNSFGCDINQPSCAALDFDSNGAVGPGDVGAVKNEFGPCPE